MDALADVGVDGYTPRMRAGLHRAPAALAATGWASAINIAARVMERATRGGVMISGETWARIPPERLDELGVYPEEGAPPVLFGAKPSRVPADLAIAIRLLADPRRARRRQRRRRLIPPGNRLSHRKSGGDR